MARVGYQEAKFAALTKYQSEYLKSIGKESQALREVTALQESEESRNRAGKAINSIR